MSTPDPGLLRLSLAIAAVRSPVILRQARHLRATVPLLPDARRPWVGAVGGPDPIRLLAFGDSTVAGAGVEDPADGLAGRLALALARELDRGVAWRAVGENGATSRDLRVRHLDEALSEPADLVYLSLGANDALAARPASAFARDLRRILAAIDERLPGAAVVMSSLPVFARFELLPEPLRTTLFRHSRLLERTARRLVEADGRRLVNTSPPPYSDGFFASDGFHPGPQGYREWADWAVQDALGRGLARRIPRDPGSGA